MATLSEEAATIVKMLRAERSKQERLPPEMCGLDAADCEDAADLIDRQAAEIAELRRFIPVISGQLAKERAEIARLRSIIGDTVWCHGCGSVVPLDKPECDCVWWQPETQRLRAYDADAHGQIADLRTEIERLRAGGCARDQGLTQFCAEVVRLDRVARFLWGLLDDIDTASDMAKDNNEFYRRRVELLQRRRFAIGTTDGYSVTFTDAHPSTDTVSGED